MVDKPGLYALVNLLSSLVACFLLVVYVLVKRDLSVFWTRFGYEKTVRLREKNAFLRGLFSKTAWLVLTAILLGATFWGSDVLTVMFPFLSENAHFSENNYFALLFSAPVFFTAVFLLLGADVRKTFDLFAPFLALEMGLGKIACFCTGCCNGIPWDNGLYNYVTGRYEVPVQLIESAIGILLAATLLYLLTRKKIDGKLYPLYIILYSGTRFFTEFLRGDHGMDWGFFRPYQILCLVGVFLGGVWLAVLLFLQPRGKCLLYGTDLIDALLARKKTDEEERV